MFVEGLAKSVSRAERCVVARAAGCLQSSVHDELLNEEGTGHLREEV